jgi:hypothetical protein
LDISKSREVDTLADQASPERIAAAAERLGCRSVAWRTRLRPGVGERESGGADSGLVTEFEEGSDSSSLARPYWWKN